MGIIMDYFEKAELSQAAYSDLAQGVIDNTGIAALQNDAGMSPTQAEEFASNWRVVDQYDGEIVKVVVDAFGNAREFLVPTGLSVTLFESADGKQVVAIRGTDDIDDVATDVIDIIAIGSTENQTQYKALSSKVQEWIDDSKLNSGFTVTGHSLGEFLATGLANEYKDDISHTYIYNAPGVTGVAGDLFETIINAISPTIPTALHTSLPITNIVASGDIASSVGRYITPPVVIEVEPQNVLGAHSIKLTTDALAVYNLLATIDPSIGVDRLSPLFLAATNQSATTLERIIYSLSDLFLGEPIEVDVDNRDQLYAAIHAIEDKLFDDRTVANPKLKEDYWGLRIIPFVRPDAAGPEQFTQTGLVKLAHTDIGYRYAITHLNPFAIIGSRELYEQHNKEGQLAIELIFDRWGMAA